MRATASLFVCLLVGAIGGALAQDSDKILPLTLGLVCEMESGAAAAACAEYCQEMSCYRANDGEGATEPSSKKECKRAAARFESLTGREVPCDEMFACPCAEPTNWDDLAAGVAWLNSATFRPDNLTCEDDSSQTKLWVEVIDGPSTVVGVDSALGECLVFEEKKRPIHTLNITNSEAKICQRLLRRAGGRHCQ